MFGRPPFRRGLRLVWPTLAASLALIVVPGLTRGETITAKVTGVSPGQTIAYSLDGSSKKLASAGNINWQQQPGNQPYVTYCVELNQNISLGNTYTYTIENDISKVPNPGTGSSGGAPGMGDTKAGWIYELFASHHSTSFTSTEAAAFQLAIWEIVFDDGTALNSGAFKLENHNGVNSLAELGTTGTAENLAQSWLNDIVAHNYTFDPNYKLVAWTHDSWQDQITMVHAAPVPAAWLMAVIGCLGITGYQRFVRGRSRGPADAPRPS